MATNRLVTIDGIIVPDYSLVYTEINQVAHSFDNDFIYNNGTIWAKAQANNSASCATHFAVRIDDDNFKLIALGEIDLTGFLDEDSVAIVDGDYYYLSQTTAGKVTATLPTTGIVQSVLKVNTSSNCSIWIEEPYNNSSTIDISNIILNAQVFG